jgi:hypothetical protein
MKVDCDNIATIVCICSFCLTFLYTPISISQGEFSSQLSSDFILSESFDWNISVEQMIWGTRWHSIKIEKSLHAVPGARIGGYWSGWEAWNRNEIWWGQEKLLGVVEDDIVIYAWLNLGIQLEILPELHKHYWSIISSSGVRTSFPSGMVSFTISPNVMDLEWPWSVTAIITPVNVNGFEVGLGFNSSIYGRGWLLTMGRNVDMLEAHLEFEGPDIIISCRLVFNGLLNKSISHRHGSFGGNTQWSVSW